MKRILLIAIVLLAGLSVYWFFFRTKKSSPEEPKQAPLSLKKHSDTFNTSIDKVMAEYHSMKNAFVDADAPRVKTHTASFIRLLDSIPLDELKKDTAVIYQSALTTVDDIRSNAQSILQQSDITEMRKDFSMVTEMLYPAFFKTINYEGENLYLQHCPMAFDGDKGANWISDNVQIVNPYLGKNHPKYRGTMLECGEVMDTIKAQ
jgi:FlaG/FlaF family flagellin (archaellin)